jgi:hypothetical protein
VVLQKSHVAKSLLGSKVSQGANVLVAYRAIPRVVDVYLPCILALASGPSKQAERFARQYQVLRRQRRPTGQTGGN